MNWLESINGVVSSVSAYVGLASAILAGLAWNKARRIRAQQIDEERRRAEPIRLILVNEQDGREHVVGYKPRRDQATRNEVLGILGMYSGGPRFDSSKLVPILEAGDFDRMIAGETNELRFPVSDEDFQRFVCQDERL